MPRILNHVRPPRRVLPIRAMMHESRQCFLRGIRPLTEEDSSYRIADAMRTVAQQVGHTAQVVEFFVEGGLGDGFDYDYVAREEALSDVTSLEAATAWVNRAFDDAIDRLERASLGDLLRRLPEGGMLSNEFTISVIGGIVDGVAHQRGVLASYIEALGRTPGFPYKLHHTLPVRVPSGVVVTG